MKKSDIVKLLIKDRLPGTSGKAFAPTNIALCKYWGKRNSELNLPVTSSLSISLADKGCSAEITIIDQDPDCYFLNDQAIDMSAAFSTRLKNFLDLFRSDKTHFRVDIFANIPIGAGLASSACGFATIVLALNELFAWKLSKHELSILARLGSGSAARSIWHGFVEWQSGERSDGMDSHGVLIQQQWPELCVGLHYLNKQEKKLSSRIAMQRTIETSRLYSAWPNQVQQDLLYIKEAIKTRDFDMLGKTAENNAMAMHATMASAWPPIVYSLEETLSAMQKIWKLREEGLSVYFTQDAGPNLKLLFLKKDLAEVQVHFPSLEIIHPFAEGHYA